jgi:peptide deformylase
MEILTAPHPALTQRCEASVHVKVQELSDMLRLMQRHGGVGLAAPQVGINGRFFVTSWGDIFVNPEIVAASETMYLSREGCLSIPGKQFIVTRHKWVRLRNDKRKHDGIKGAVLQHECDHLNGVLISALGKEITGPTPTDARHYIHK